VTEPRGARVPASGGGEREPRRALAGWPVNMLVSARPVLVVGAGRIAARKIEPLLDLGADVTVVAPTVGPEVGALAADGRLQVVERTFQVDDLDGAWLVVTATGDHAVDAAVFEAAEARRIWCNSADDPSQCSFTLLSTVRQSDIVVAIGTGGRSPALATFLKRRVEAELGPEYGVLLDLLSEAREEIRGAGHSSEDADWQRALESGIVDMVRDGNIVEAKEQLRSCL
jgi:siroheme synthase-like protein